MNILRQLFIIFAVYVVSLCIEAILPFSFPASVIGILLLFALICFKVLPASSIKDVGDFLHESPFFGLSLTILVCIVAAAIHHKINFPLFNTFLISIVTIITLLMVFDIPFESYYIGGSIINYFLAPATVCLGISIYDKLPLLKKNLIPVLTGCFAGVIASVGSILIMCRLFGLDNSMTGALLPKSVTTLIATALSEANGSNVSVTVAAVIVAGLTCSIGAPFFVKMFRIKDPLAVGLGLGACSHALGTAKAMEFGSTEGAVGALAISLCGIITSIVIMFLNIFI